MPFKPDESKLQFDTLALHGGHVPDSDTLSRAVPLYLSSSFVFEDADHAARLFGLEQAGNIYTRLGNPTTAILEKRLALLEGGVAALATASGQAAELLAITNIAQAGDHIVAGSTLYGGTYALMKHTLPRMGIETSFVDPDDVENFRQAIRPNTKALYAETLGNPLLNVIDIQAIADIAHEAGIPLIIDNTMATCALVKPLEHGADIVVYSATKYLAGHGAVIGGAIIDSGKFDWNNVKFPGFTKPDASYHGLVFADMGAMAFINKARLCGLRDLGACISPFNAWAIMIGVETLGLRMERHSSNAMKVAQYLEAHPNVAWISYPGLASSSTHEIAKRYFKDGQYSGMIGFGIKGGLEAGKAFINKLKLISLLANIGDAKSLVIHPASTTHQQLSAEEQVSSGVTPDFIRLSVGIEDVQDIIADLEQALTVG